MVSALAEIRRCAQLSKYLEGQSSKSSQAKSVVEKCFSAKLAKAGDDLIEWDDLVCDGRLLNRDDNESYAENLLSLSHLATRVPAEPSQVRPLTQFFSVSVFTSRLRHGQEKS